MLDFLKSEIRNSWLKYFYILILIILVFPYFTLYLNPEAGLDNSWKIALELIKEKGLIFGQDVIYTYGPLGTLTQRLAITSTPLEIFLFDIFFFINLGILLFLLLPARLNLYQLVVHFSLFFLVSNIYGEWVHFLFFYCSVFFGIRFLRTKNHWLLANAIFLCIVNFFIKANYGIVGLGTIALLIVYFLLTKRLTLKEFALYYIGGSFVLWVMAFALKTDLTAYFFSSFQVISGYNEAQSVFFSGRLKIISTAFFIWFVLLFLGGYYCVRYIIQNKKITTPFADNVFIWCLSVVLSFILIKYAFVRADEGHISAFTKLVTLPLLFLPVFSTSKILTNGSWMLIIINTVSYVVLYPPLFGKMRLPFLANLQAKCYILPEYFKNVVSKPEYNYPFTYPADVLRQIGNKSVDIIPNEISEIYFHKLNYEPRPTLQSYQAYNEYLDNKNKEKFLSQNAPEFVIYGVESIDGKYAWGDETQTLLAILKRYKPVNIWKDRLLFEKQKTTKKTVVVKLQTSTLKLGEEYQILPDSMANSVRVLNIKSSYNWFGKLLKFFFQPPHLILTITTEDGHTTSYNTVPILLEKGLIVNSRIDNVQDVKQFFENFYVPGKVIKSISIKEDVLLMPGVSNELTIEPTLYKLE